MEYYLFIARSVTYAQRIERVFARAGIRSAVFRAPFELTGGAGCAYAVRIAPDAASAAEKLLSENGLTAVRAFRSDAAGIREVEV